MENLTTGEMRTSRDNSSLMTVFPVDLKEPIVGRISSVNVGGNDVTSFSIEDGALFDHVFVRAGETQKGQDAITEILGKELNTYDKIVDPYISVDTIAVLSAIPKEITILVLTENVEDLEQVRNKAASIGRKIQIKRTSKLHDRFILTQGSGWAVGHSLKDFGKRMSYITRMTSSTDAEIEFDTRWVESVSLI